MNLQEAFEYMDMLLDRADKPYFTNEEKHKFLSLAISEFINTNYAKMSINEDARKALSGLTVYRRFELTNADIASGGYFQGYNRLSNKYKSDGIYDSAGVVIPNSQLTDPDGPNVDNMPHFAYGNELVLPKKFLYLLSIQIVKYNFRELIDPTTGLVRGGLTIDDIKTDKVNAKALDIKEGYDLINSNDPFVKKDTQQDAGYYYIGNRIMFDEYTNINIKSVLVQYLSLPDVEDVFSDEPFFTSGNAQTLTRAAFNNHYRKKLVQLAVRKMSANVEDPKYQTKQIESQM
tara:strand:+ start:3457 stop:4323 length:867 start_codon:yes stop_codon:yes gene_type:complete